MTTSQDPGETSDPYDLHRFVQAQALNYDQAFRELQQGQKRSHWMWYVFPQYAGLGFSSTSIHYSIKSMAEAQAYLAHPLLGQRLRACAEAVLSIEGRSARTIFGSPDDMKLQSSATLFASISPPESVFHQILNRYFQGALDPETLKYAGLNRDRD